MKIIFKEHKKTILISIFVIFAYTLNALYLYTEVNEAKAKLLEASKPSFIEEQKDIIDELYKDREDAIDNIQRMQESIKEGLEFKEYTEHVIRCEKENIFSKSPVDCENLWKNYPKK